jgi:hypothetical protein
MGQKRFTCPVCGMVSHNPDDVANGYCGQCKAFTREAAEVLLNAVVTLRHMGFAIYSPLQDRGVYAPKLVKLPKGEPADAPT